MLSRGFSFLFLASTALAIDFSQWTPPGPNDVRSPCPGLNAMANHGILPHDGKGLTVDKLTKAMKDTFNIGADLRTVLAIRGVLASPHFPSLTIQLDDLNKHNYLEHDGSLSRADFHLGGDDHTFRQDIFDEVLSYYNGSDVTTVQTASQARYHRIKADQQADSQFVYGVNQFILSYGESALYLMGLGNATQSTPVDFVKILFEQERLPWTEGWRPPTGELNLLSVTGFITSMLAAGGEVLPEGLLLGNNTLARAILGLDQFKDDIPPFLSGLLAKFGLGGLF